MNYRHNSGGPITAMPQLTGAFVVFLLLASCATSTEDERAERMYDREDGLTLAREEYERRRVACQRHGGAMQIPKYSSSKLKQSAAHDYRMAQCVKLAK